GDAFREIRPVDSSLVQKKSVVDPVVIIIAQVESALVAANRLIEITAVLCLLPHALVDRTPKAKRLSIVRHFWVEQVKETTRVLEGLLRSRGITFISGKREPLDDVGIFSDCTRGCRRPWRCGRFLAHAADLLE